MTTEEKITHYVPGNWGGRGILTAICGARVVYTFASSTSTNCPECQEVMKARESPSITCPRCKKTSYNSGDIQVNPWY